MCVWLRLLHQVPEAWSAVQLTEGQLGRDGNAGKVPSVWGTSDRNLESCWRERESAMELLSL